MLGCILAVAGVFLAPILVARIQLRERLVAQLSEQLGAPVEVAMLRLSLLPLPHVVLEGLHLAVAPWGEATIEAVSVYPRLGGLLAGKLQLARVTLSGATVSAQLPRTTAPERTPTADRSMQAVRTAAAAALGKLSAVTAAHAPGLRVEVTRGAANVTREGQETITLADIHGMMEFPPTQVLIELHAGSNLWDEASLSATLDPASVRGDGRLALTGVRPRLVAGHLLPADLELGDGTASIDARLQVNGGDALRADLEATLPTLPLQRASQQLIVQGAHVKATVVVDGEKIDATLGDVQLTNPPLQLSAKLALDRAIPQARVDIEGRNLDVAKAHEAALFFAAASPVARSIFNILQEGKVAHLTLHAQAQSLAELASLDVMQIRGSLADGTIRLPGSGLQIDDVSGEVSVINGVLIGERAAGRVGNTRATDGSVRVGLTGASPELSVRTAVHADVSDLPSVLDRVVDNETLIRSLAQLTDLRGSAEGILSLSGTTDTAAAAVEVSQLSVTAGVRNLDQPVHVEGGTFHYDPTGIAAAGLQVSSGSSTLVDVGVGVDLRPAQATIDVKGGGGRITLEELCRSVVASGRLPDSEWTPKAVRGTLTVQSVRLRGPAANPGRWRVDLAGGAERLDVDAPRLRQRVAVRFPVALSELRLSYAPEALSVSTAAAFADGLNAAIDLAWNTAGVNIKRLSIRDGAENATLSLLLKERELDVTFAGNLGTAVLKELLPDEHDAPRTLQGDFQARIVMDEPTRSTATGRLEIAHVVVPMPGEVSVHLTQATLRAASGMLAVDADGDVRDAAPFHLHGALRPARDAFVADLDVSAGDLEWARLAALVPPPSEQPHERAVRLPLRGKVRLAAASFAYGGYTWRPLHAVVDLSSSAPSLTVTQATLCDIATPATIAATPQGIRGLVKPTAKNQPLGTILPCLFGGTARITGQCSLAAQIAAAGEGAALRRSAQGHIDATSKDGRIYQGGWMEKVLAVTSIGHGSWNILKDLTDDGLPYNTIHVKADLRDGKLVLTEATMDAPSMKMVAEGSIDIDTETLHLTLLAAPLKSVDSVVRHIPILGSVLGGNLLTIPIKVDGPVRDPQVTPMDPSEVGSGLLRVMTRIAKLPLSLLSPFLPSSEK